MADDSIEAKALALINEERAKTNNIPLSWVQVHYGATAKALCRAIEQHEAFRLEVSNAVKDACKFAKDNPDRWAEYLAIRFSFIIIPKLNADPMAEALKSLAWDAEASANRLRAQLDAFGFEIREKGQ
jgi:hypothetical protein